LKTASNTVFHRLGLIDQQCHHWIISLFMISLLVLPFGFMTFKGLFGVLSAICLLLSLLALGINSDYPTNFFKEKYSFLIILCLSATVLSLLLTQAIRGDISSAPYDGPVRLLAALPILIAIYKHRINFPKLLSLVIPLALLGILIFAKLGTHTYDERLTNHYLDPIFWGNFSIILGFMSFASIQSQDHLLLKIYKFSGLALGISMSLMSRSRAGWIAAIIMALVWLALNRKELTFKKLVVITFASLLTLILLFIFVESFAIRINDGISEISGWLNKTQIESATGYRLTMWKMTVHLFSQSPWVGYGEFSTLPVAKDSYILSFADAESIFTIQCCGPHNEVAAQTLRSGIFGIFALLATYMIPMYIFLRSKVSQSTLMGMMLCTGVFICGFATEILGLKISYTFYAILTSGLIATTLWQKKIIL
jgi:O-antigen ligase